MWEDPGIFSTRPSARNRTLMYNMQQNHSSIPRAFVDESLKKRQRCWVTCCVYQIMDISNIKERKEHWQWNCCICSAVSEESWGVECRRSSCEDSACFCRWGTLTPRFMLACPSWHFPVKFIAAVALKCVGQARHPVVSILPLLLLTCDGVLKGILRTFLSHLTNWGHDQTSKHIAAITDCLATNRLAHRSRYMKSVSQK
jgi:hypothetical protein